MAHCPTVQCLPVHASPSVDAVIAAIASRREPAVLDSANTTTAYGRYTIVTADPVETVSWRADEHDPFEAMRHHLERTRIDTKNIPNMPANLGFPCGWIGYFAYEAGYHIEPTARSCRQREPSTVGYKNQGARDDLGLPIARFALYDTAAIHDAQTGRWTLVAVDLQGCSEAAANRPSIADRLAEWTDILCNAKPKPLPSNPPPTTPQDNMTREDYLAMVTRAKEYIAAGDIFQVNLARRQTFPINESPATTYLRLRQTNPGAYAAFLAWSDPPQDQPVSIVSSQDASLPPNDQHPAKSRSASNQVAILSASPELFLQLQGQQVLTRPIKGTRPRCDDTVTDAAYQMELATSEKDRAELAMIVDLERNDLGRVCEFGTVRVVSPATGSHNDAPAHPYQLEAHPTVHHLVADVVGQLRESYDAIDLVRACFPGGSITGAPKVRAMQIIDELEPNVRSVYTGAIGIFGLDGSMTLNIAIRTVIVTNNMAHIYAGGGIVADSIPADEFEETRAKSRGLCSALTINNVEPTSLNATLTSEIRHTT